MARIDYYIKYDRNSDTELTIFMKILYALIIKRLKFHKPTIIHIGGKSGEGKSLTVVYIMDLLLKMQGLDIRDFFEDVNIFNQSQYPYKIEALINEKRLKKVNVMAVHEGREAMEANEWRSLFNRNVAHVNALSRALKPMCFLIISQTLKDITKDMRRTFDFQIKVVRPLMRGEQGHARLKWYVLYDDDRDLENIQLRRREVKGILMTPQNRWIYHHPQYISIPKVDKDLKEIFDIMDRASKLAILTNKLEDMKHEIDKQNVNIDKRIDDLVKFYSENDAARLHIARITPRNKYRVTKEFMKAHDLKPSEIKLFEKKLTEELNRQNEENPGV